MNRGDVVEVDWPYSDLMGSKLRPAVVVQADFLNGLIDDTIIRADYQYEARHSRNGSGNRSGSRNGLGSESSLLCQLYERADARPGESRASNRLPVGRGNAADRGVPEGCAGTAVIQRTGSTGCQSLACPVVFR